MSINGSSKLRLSVSTSSPLEIQGSFDVDDPEKPQPMIVLEAASETAGGDVTFASAPAEIKRVGERFQFSGILTAPNVPGDYKLLAKNGRPKGQAPIIIATADLTVTRGE